MAKRAKDTKTFICNIRTDFRYIATIAKFLHSEGKFMETRSRLASEAIRVLAHSVPKEFYITSYEKAEMCMQTMGYGSLLDGYYKNLKDKISLEKSQPLDEAERIRIIKENMEKINRDYVQQSSAANIEAAKSIIAVEEEVKEVEETEKVESEAEPEADSGPEAESEQLKTRTAADEQKDIKRFKKGLGTIPEEAVSDE